MKGKVDRYCQKNVQQGQLDRQDITQVDRHVKKIVRQTKNQIDKYKERYN